MPVYNDLLWYFAVFLAAWVIYIVAYILCARLGVVHGAGRGIVALGVGAAFTAGLLCWFFLGERFSSTNVHIVASVSAPICFLGFCGIFVLLGPVTVDRSITLTILWSLQSVEDRELSKEQLMGAVPLDRIYNKRLKELSASGVIELHEHGVSVTPKGARALKLYLWLGRLLNVKLQ